MSSRLFDSFADMIEGIPVKAVLGAAQAERRMLEEDLEHKRMSPQRDVLSILTFCEFLEVAAGGGHMALSAELPIEHCAFYRRVLCKLIDAGELAPCVQDDFDHAFSSALFKALTAPA